VVELCPPFDLVVDDGSHVRSHIIASFEALFPAVNPGGLYTIEDLDAVYPRSLGRSYDTAGSVASIAKSLSDDSNLDRRHLAAVRVGRPREPARSRATVGAARWRSVALLCDE
jgi:hypothetical protein